MVQATLVAELVDGVEGVAPVPNVCVPLELPEPDKSVVAVVILAVVVDCTVSLSPEEALAETSAAIQK